MPTSPNRRTLGIALVALAAAGSTASAQGRACETGGEPRGAYRECALNVVPRWNGLAVVRGEREDHLATLGFFWAGSLGGIFDADPRAAEFARQAVRTRRVAAFLTDVGAAALVIGVVRAAGPHGWDATARGFGFAGAAAFAVSVPLQFRADGHLSRAIWHLNSQFARSTP